MFEVKRAEYMKYRKAGKYSAFPDYEDTSSQETGEIHLKNARIVLPEKIISGEIIVQGSKITCLGAKFRKRGLTIDVDGRFAAPGFIDLHVHGDAEHVSGHFVRSGTTGFLYTPLEKDLKRVLEQLELLKTKKITGARMLGIHLEGPFINRKMSGAIPVKCTAQTDKKLLHALIKKSIGLVRIITLAPELGGIFELFPVLKKKHIIIAMGHTNATAACAEQAVAKGVTYATHTYNRMSKIKKADCGAVGVILKSPRIFAEVIADGVHVGPDLLKLLINSKGTDKIVLVTDSVALADITSAVKKGRVFQLKTGRLAGSTLTMIEAVKNVVKLTGLTLVDAVKLASTNPARVLGIDKQKGSIGVGKDADLVIFDKYFRVWMTVVEGRIVWNKYTDDRR
ncbi:MAG: N-acetylglucosamine-6-phosphate deacetylase [Candidatus Omnitrophota bacterium]